MHQEDVNMIEGEPQIQPTNPSRTNNIAHADDGANARVPEVIPADNVVPNDVANGVAEETKTAQTETPLVTPAELVDRFEYLSKLGEGTYGIVYKALDKVSKKEVAVKDIKIDHCDDGIPSTAIREIAVLQELRNNPNIVNLMEIVHGLKQNRLFLVFEYFNLDMKKYLDKQGGPMTPRQCKSILYQLLKGTEYCHQRRILHRDLKPSNLLVDPSGRKIKIADFGLARTMGLPLKTYTHEVVTLWYRAPEVLLGSKIYSTAIDMWSVGAIFFELAHKKPLFAGDSEIGQIFKIFRTLGTPTEETWQGFANLPEMKLTFPHWRCNAAENIRKMCKNLDNEAIDLLQQMVHLEPGRRISARAALNHPYFAGFNPNQVDDLSDLDWAAQ